MDNSSSPAAHQACTFASSLSKFNGSSSHESGQGAHATQTDPTGIGLLIVVTMSLSIVLRLLMRWFPILNHVPYTAFMLCLGMCLGALDSTASSALPAPLSSSIHAWVNLSPHTILYLFLPPLLFASAFVVDWHIFKRLSSQALLLAGPGVLLSVLLTAIFAKYGLWAYNWNWNESLLFGAMVSATDPVAVVALLHEVGAPDTLAVLIESESLLNDGSAFAIFMIFAQRVTEFEPQEPSAILVEVVMLSIVGPLIGIATGGVSILALRLIWNSSTLQVVLTATTAWGSFYLADLWGASGVLSTVAAGLTLAGYSLAYMPVSTSAELKQFWRVIEEVANSCVFMFAGIVVIGNLTGGETSQPGLPPRYQASVEDFALLGASFVVINLVRVMMIALLYPLLRRTGYGFNRAKALVVSGAGLRGAVGLVSGLFVMESCFCDEARASEGLDGEACLTSDDGREDDVPHVRPRAAHTAPQRASDQALAQLHQAHPPISRRAQLVREGALRARCPPRGISLRAQAPAVLLWHGLGPRVGRPARVSPSRTRPAAAPRQ